MKKLNNRNRNKMVKRANQMKVSRSLQADRPFRKTRARKMSKWRVLKKNLNTRRRIAMARKVTLQQLLSNRKRYQTF